MKKTVYKVLAFILASVMVFTSAVPAFAFKQLNLSGSSITSRNWMSGIKDDTLLSNISIPGTHDSGTMRVDLPTFSQTQSLSIKGQLDAGIRYFDLRLERVTDVVYNVQIVHGTSKCWNENGGHLTLYEVLNDMYEFLDANPSETLIVSVKKDAGDDINALADDVNTLIDLNSKYWFTGYYTPNLGSVRGKCVLTTRISELGRGISLSWGDQGSDGGAVDSGWMKVQDRYNMSADNKWNNAVKPMLNETKPDDVWYVNFLSTTGGGIPNPKANADTVNAYYRGYELVNNKCYGIVCFDFISYDMVQKLYQCNDLVAKNQPSKESGQYYYRVNWNVNDDVPSGWNSVSLRLYYKENNGTGAEKSILLFDQNDYTFVCNIFNFDFSGYVNGYPTRLQFSYNWQNNTDGLGINQRLYVSASPNEAMTLIAKNDFFRQSSNSAAASATENYNSAASSYPKVQSIDFADSGATTINVPDVDSTAVNTYTFDCKMYDQYGVRWQGNPTSYTASANYAGITYSGNAVKVDRTANNLPRNTSFLMYASYNNGTSTVQSSAKKIIVNTNKIPYKFVNSDGEVLESGSDYAGVIPEYTGQTPYREPDSNGHYTFSNWAPLTPLSMSNNEYTAFYTSNAHLVSRSVVNTPATCTSSGSATNYCICGYSWDAEIAPTGHNYITEHKDPTCTEDGYDREICRSDGDIKTQTVIPATGHNTEDAYAGSYIHASEGGNGYTPYYCPICKQEIVSLRQYDTIDWSEYYDAVTIVNGIKSDPDYASYSEVYRNQFEDAVNSAMDIENSDPSTVLQVAIDSAAVQLTDAIDDFCNGVGVKYYTLTFVFDNGSKQKLAYKANTEPTQIAVPENTATVMTTSTHTNYKWPSIKTVTKNATYVESNVKRAHTFNTFIAPDEIHIASCTEGGYIKHTCICGYTFNEKTDDATTHDYGDWVSNNNGTHTRACKNNSSHTQTENCTVNPITHKCIICEYRLDTSAYDAMLKSIQDNIDNTKKYTDDSITNTKSALESIQQRFYQAVTQQEVDNLTTELFMLIINLQIKSYTVSFVYVIDDDNAVKVSESSLEYDKNFTCTVPSSVMAGAVIEKWTIRLIDNNYTQKSASTSNKMDVVVHDNAEYVAYVSTQASSTVQTSKISVTDISGRVTDIIYIPNGDYEVECSGDTVTFTSATSSYSISARHAVFYRISSFSIDSQPVQSHLTLNGDITITPVYSA